MFFNLKGIKGSVFFDQKVDLVHILVPVEIQGQFEDPPVIVAFDDLRYDEAFKKRARHGSVFQYIRRIPPGQISGKPCVQKIELWRFDGPFCNVVGIGLEQIYDIGGD